MESSREQAAPRIGILALQGAFIEHKKMLASLGAECVELRQLKDLEGGLDGIVLPGGESSVQVKLLRELGMFEPLRAAIENGLPVLATCAGLILLAAEISNDTRRGFATLPVKVERNAYGRQLGSFCSTEDFAGIGPFQVHFIRAPRIDELLNEAVEVMSREGDTVTAVRYGNQLAMSFHPELGDDTRIHFLFLDMVRAYRQEK